MKRNWNQYIHPGLSASQQIIILGDAPGASQTPPTPILVDEGGGMISWSYAGPNPDVWGVYIAPVGDVHDLQIDAVGSMTSLDVSFLIGQTIQIIGLDLGEDTFTTPPSNAVLVSSGIEPFWTPPEFDLETALGFTLGVTDLSTFVFGSENTMTGVDTVTFPMTNANNVSFQNETTLEIMSAPNLTLIQVLNTGGCSALLDVNFPALQTCVSTIRIAAADNLNSIELDSLLSVGMSDASDFLLYDSTGCPLLNYVNVPLLTEVGGNLNWYQNGLTTADLPSLQTVGAAIAMGQCPNLTTINVPSLLTMGNGWDTSGSVNLTTIVGDQWTVADGSSMNFNSCALDVATVNLILARAVASGVTSCDINLQDGTSAAPTGQGLLDMATLIAAGNSVETN